MDEIKKKWGEFRFDMKERNTLKGQGFTDAEIDTAEKVNNAGLLAWIQRKLGV